MIVFVGVNGVGKSTNLAKIAYWLVQNKMTVSQPVCCNGLMPHAHQPADTGFVQPCLQASVLMQSLSPVSVFVRAFLPFHELVVKSSDIMPYPVLLAPTCEV